jgi:hypothetical protein
MARKSLTGAPNYERLNTWTPAIAAEWAGIPLRALYRLLREGAVPCIPMGDTQNQNWPKGRNGKRKRTCYRFIIPRVAFVKAWESIGKPPRDMGTAA